VNQMIYFEVNQKSGKKIPKRFWEFWLKKCVQTLKIKKNYEISLALVGATEMKKLNTAFRGKNKVTDVLSFAENDVSMGNAPNYLGEIIICYPKAVSQAKILGHKLETELAWLLIHGFLHLLGYDDQTAKQAKTMESLTEKIIKRVKS